MKWTLAPMASGLHLRLYHSFSLKLRMLKCFLCYNIQGYYIEVNLIKVTKDLFKLSDKIEQAGYQAVSSTLTSCLFIILVLLIYIYLYY